MLLAAELGERSCGAMNDAAPMAEKGDSRSKNLFGPPPRMTVQERCACGGELEVLEKFLFVGGVMTETDTDAWLL